ncbi:MAG: FtsX-like permease family protein, partial [Clostridiales bacterium]|nr:FtsX-like permease family protein [Clostridiales bacterium]
MKYLMLKTFRDIRETIGSFVSIVLVIFIGCFFFAGIIEATTAVTNKVEDYCTAQNLASARATYMFVNSAAVDEIEAADGVTKAAGYDAFYTKLKGTRTDINITTLTDGIDTPDILRGKAPKGGEIIIDSVYADAHKVKLGDELTFSVDALKSLALTADGYTAEYEPIEYTLTVSGVYHSPDVIFKVDVMNTAATSEEFVMAYVNYGEIGSYTENASVNAGGYDIPIFKLAEAQGVKIYNSVKILGTPKDKEIFERYTVGTDNLAGIIADPTKAAGLYVYEMERNDIPAITAYNGINEAIGSLAAVLPLIFFAVAAAITVISLSKTVDNQRMQIGVIQALGISKGSVYFSYIFYALFACLIGGLTGGIVGTYSIPYLLEFIYNNQFSMPPTSLNIGIAYIFIGVAIAAGLACLSAFLSCHRTLKAAPAQAMRPKPPKKTKRILAERWTWLWKHLGFGAKMNMRNMFLHKLRMLLSSVGIIGCIALLIGLVGLKDNMAYSFRYYDNQAGYDIAVYALGAADVTDSASYEKLLTDEVDKLTFIPAFSAKFELDGETADQTLIALPTAADAQRYETADADCIKLYTDLAMKNRLVIDENTLAISEGLAEALGADVGSAVTLSGRTLGGDTVSFEAKITAIVGEYFEQKAFCSYGFFENHGIALYADTAYATAKKGVDVKTAVSALEENEAVRAAQTFREVYETWEDKMSLLDYAVILFVVGAGVLAVAVIYN